MKISIDGIKALVRWEGMVKKGDLHMPYDDRNGELITEWSRYATIGYGHLIKSEDSWSFYKDGIDDETALELKYTEIREMQTIVNNRLKSSGVVRGVFSIEILNPAFSICLITGMIAST